MKCTSNRHQFVHNKTTGKEVTRKRCFYIFVSSLLATLFLAFFARPVYVHADSSVSCNQVSLPVTLSSTDPTVYHVVGFLCAQGPLQGKTVQLLLHGGSYDHNYWDWPIEPEKYSFVRKAVDVGYATFNIDRIGTGLSDHPLSTLVTLQSNAFVVHEIVQDLRQGVIGDTPFSKVVSIGHSLGSYTALLEASMYADVDGLILTGFAHQFNTVHAQIGASDFYPAQDDPKFGSSNFPGLYTTTVPGTRGPIFYNLSDADPNVISLDEQLKQTVTDGEDATLFGVLDPTISQSVQVPVLIGDGQNDFLLCGTGLSCANSQAILQRESSDFSTQACLEAFVLPNSGHSINLHLNAHDWFEAAADWANRRIGSSVNTPPSQPCH